MSKYFSCTSCEMEFSDTIRLKRHVKKAHPPKRKIDPAPSAGFNHAFFPM
jgi:uncharacterized C2H2 Zn-finger protein